MSFDWKNFVLLSEELALKEDEASLRSSISRGYYGVFCIARNKMGYKKYRGKNIHSRVIAGWKKETRTDKRKIGWYLDELRKARNRADYDEDIVIKKIFVERILIIVREALTNLERV